MRSLGALPSYPVSILAVVMLAAGCADSESEPPVETAVDTSLTGSLTERPSPELDDSLDPLFGFDLDAPAAGTSEQHRLALRLRNDGEEDALVFADAGAGEVLVDSVAAGSWTRVDILTRASRVVLRSATPAGRNLRRIEIETELDMLREVVIQADVEVP